MAWTQVDDVDSQNTTWLPHHQPIRRVSVSRSGILQPSPLPCLYKPFPKSHRGVQVSCTWAAHSLCLAPHWVPCNKHYTFLHHSPVSIDWLCYPLGQLTRVWFGNKIINIEKHTSLTLYFLVPFLFIGHGEEWGHSQNRWLMSWSKGVGVSQ